MAAVMFAVARGSGRDDLADDASIRATTRPVVPKERAASLIAEW